MSEYHWVGPFDFVRVIVSQLFQRHLAQIVQFSFRPDEVQSSG